MLIWVWFGKYSTHPIDKVGEHLILWTCIVSHEKGTTFIFPHTWHNCHTLLLKLQLECDMGWCRYTSHGENHSRECDMGWDRYMSHSENHSTESDIGWYRYTSHNENHYTECDIGWYRYTSHSENHCTECDEVVYRFALWRQCYG